MTPLAYADLALRFVTPGIAIVGTSGSMSPFLRGGGSCRAVD